MPRLVAWPRFLSWSPLLLGLLICLSAVSMSACYRPSVTNGGLVCSTASPACPAGYACASDRHCWKTHTGPGETGGAGGQTGTGGAGGITDGGVDRAEVGTGGSKVDASSADGAGDAKDANLCNQPVAGCTSPAIVGCDPVCQSGCGCKEKCSRGVDGTAVCQPSGGFQNVGDPCTVNNPGLANQSDNCVAGAVCLSDSGTNPRCFALCNTSADCASHGALCVNHYLAPSGSSPSVRVCDPPLMACDPFAAGAAGNCANCYVTEPSSTGTSQTVCEYWSGPRARDTDLCQSSGDCSGRLVCPQVSTAARFHLCSILCDLSGNHGCPINQACILIGNRYGFCSS